MMTVKLIFKEKVLNIRNFGFKNAVFDGDMNKHVCSERREYTRSHGEYGFRERNETEKSWIYHHCRILQ